MRGFSKLNPAIPEPLRGTYAGLAHDASLEYLTDLGVTTVELLPVHAFVTEQRLVRQGRLNYWGYNTLAFFARARRPTPRRPRRPRGRGAVRREFTGMVRRLHEAGLEVVLDVVYNHTAEEGRQGPTYSFRGIDNAVLLPPRRARPLRRHDRLRQHPRLRPRRRRSGSCSTRCGTSPSELQVDGFRLDLAATLGRDDHGGYTPEHPLLRAMLEDPMLCGAKLIAEPWDVGPGGWQTGNFPAGFSEWNDRYRDRMRDFWLGDHAS